MFEARTGRRKEIGGQEEKLYKSTEYRQQQKKRVAQSKGEKRERE